MSQPPAPGPRRARLREWFSGLIYWLLADHDHDEPGRGL